MAEKRSESFLRFGLSGLPVPLLLFPSSRSCFPSLSALWAILPHRIRNLLALIVCPSPLLSFFLLAIDSSFSIFLLSLSSLPRSFFPLIALPFSNVPSLSQYCVRARYWEPSASWKQVGTRTDNKTERGEDQGESMN